MRQTETYSNSWFGYSTENDFGGIYNNINNK